MKKVKIALLGLGNVGRGVYIILQQNKEEIMKRSGISNPLSLFISLTNIFETSIS